MEIVPLYTPISVYLHSPFPLFFIVLGGTQPSPNLAISVAVEGGLKRHFVSKSKRH